MSNEHPLARDMLVEVADNAGAFDPGEAVVSIDDALRICTALAARPSPARDKVLEAALSDVRMQAGFARMLHGKDDETDKSLASIIGTVNAALKVQPPSTVGEDHIADAGKMVAQPIGLDEREKIARDVLATELASSTNETAKRWLAPGGGYGSATVSVRQALRAMLAFHDRLTGKDR